MKTYDDSSLNSSVGEALPCDLGDGLLLRRATPADAEALADFNAQVHRDRDAKEPNERVRAWVQDLMSGTHPTFRPEDFTLVEDTHTGAIVSSLCLISQTWTYEGIPFKVGRPEIVGTHPDYRRRGLVRAQFETIHRWSAERGEVVQAITGIPWYYRQFGFGLGEEHPVYAAFAGCLPEVRDPYAWYIRVADLVGFVRHVAPALERRLAASDAAGYTGELKVSFYRSGLLLKLEQGRLTEITNWSPDPSDWGNAAFPNLTFLHLLFGHRTCDELRYVFCDCWTDNSEVRAVLDGLFPKRPSHVWAIN
jgi:hypothetical protein